MIGARALSLLGLVAVLGAASVARAVQVPQAQIDAENARWASLGVRLPPGGIVLREPYKAPYSNRSFVVPFGWYRQFYNRMRARHDYPVRAGALRADLPTLRLLMEKTYAGYGTAAARGWNWSGWFRRWDRDLAARGDATLSLRQAFAPWGRLEDAQLDNHSGVPDLMAFTSGSTSAVLAQRPNAACTAIRMSDGQTLALSVHDPGQQPHAVSQWNDTAFAQAWYVSFPKRDGSPSQLQCGSQSIALQPVAASRAPGDKPAYESWADGIAYVRMPTFSDANDDALRAALAKAPNLGKERAVLLDLRGNEGGNAPMDLLTNWFAQSAIDQAASPSSQYGTQSCFRTALFFGLQQQLASGLKPPVSDAPQLHEMLQQIVDPLAGPSNCEIEPTVQRGDHSLRDHRFSAAPTPAGQTRVIAIVDGGCGSDCEYMTYVLAGLPDTVIAGSSTYGVMGFTQPGYFVLPHSRVPFRLALSRTDAYGDGRSVDGYGITVDVLLASAQSQSRDSLVALARMLSR